ncbi:MAG: hypothetical protein HUU20_27065, partial [Pirellulales bacterium]|nr:hypothetical protein [Pirellulales bacterium]
MRAVSRFESNLLRIVYGIVGQAPRAEVVPLVLREMEPPRGLSRDAVDLVQDALAKGCVRLLARGGWRRERFLRGDQPVEGRLWQRTPPGELALSFSRNAMELLLWMTSRNPADREEAWRPRSRTPPTTGDRLLVFLAYRALRGTSVGDGLRHRAPWAGHALCRLAFADDFAESPSREPIDWRPWMTGTGACVVEAFQHELADHWVRMERRKGELSRAAEMLAIGDAQQRVLDSFFDALEEHGRRDLSRFALMTAERLLRREPRAETWFARLNVGGLTVGQRAGTYRAALAFLRALERLEHWQRQALAVGYFDEGYAASQLWKSDWERFDGDRCLNSARAIVRRADPMR